MKIYFLGNKIAGLIGKLTVLAEGHKIVTDINDCDILLCVHWLPRILKSVFEKPRIASINVHPYLYKYKGLHPVDRAIKDRNWHASVGSHHITEEFDGGEVVMELFKDIEPSEHPSEVYNHLYPLYSQVIIESLNILEQNYYNAQEEPDVLVGGLGYPC